MFSVHDGLCTLVLMVTSTYVEVTHLNLYLEQLMIDVVYLPCKLRPTSHAVTRGRPSMECPVRIKACLRLVRASSTPAWRGTCCWGSLLSGASLGTRPSGVACPLSANVRNCNNNQSSLIYLTSFLTGNVA